MSVADQVSRMCAEVRGEIYGPETLYGMSALFERYRRAVKLAEYNLSGRNPSNPRDRLGFGAKLQRQADELAHSFLRFPEVLRKVEGSGHG